MSTQLVGEAGFKPALRKIIGNRIIGIIPDYLRLINYIQITLLPVTGWLSSLLPTPP